MVTSQRLFQEPPVQWLNATPLWAQQDENGERTAFRQPALLRFATDSFMEDFMTVATTMPRRLGEWQVQKETWRRPAPIPPLQPQGAAALAIEDPALADEPLKLYQPGHQRFYLVTANLVCRIPGLPDKMLNFSNEEQVSFVLRRQMRDPVDGTHKEHALVNGGWQLLADGAALTVPPGEEQFPLFPVTYREEEGQQRRIFAGLVPVSAREKFLTARRQGQAAPALPAPGSNEARRDQLLTVLDVDVLEPWRNVNSLWQREDGKIDPSFAEIDAGDRDELRTTVNKARDKLQVASWYVLLDLAYYLRDFLNATWLQILADPDGSVPAGMPGSSLIAALQDAHFRPETRVGGTDGEQLAYLHNRLQGREVSAGDTSLARALKEVFAARNQLESATTEYAQESTGWPTTKFLLCGQDVRAVVDQLEALVSAALVEAPPPATQRLPLVPEAKAITATVEDGDLDDDLFFIRCVFQRPNCPPSVRPTVLSAPTQPFQLASYFDPDAPARPIRIPLPLDTTPAGLRKFARNTMFQVSDTLACQIEKARGISFGDLVLSVLPWPFHKDLPDPGSSECADGKLDFGLLCTLSIPIITLCALILLIIIVFLLDVIFKWVPYLIFCLPIPGLKAKKDSS